MIGPNTQKAIRILARTTRDGSKPFTIYYLLFTIDYFCGSNNSVNRCKSVSKKGRLMKKTGEKE